MFTIQRKGTFSGSRSFSSQIPEFPDLLFKVQTILESSLRGNFLELLKQDVNMSRHIDVGFNDIFFQSQKNLSHRQSMLDVDQDLLIKRQNDFILYYIHTIIEDHTKWQTLFWVEGIVDFYADVADI